MMLPGNNAVFKITYSDNHKMAFRANAAGATVYYDSKLLETPFLARQSSPSHIYLIRMVLSPTTKDDTKAQSFKKQPAVDPMAGKNEHWAEMATRLPEGGSDPGGLACMIAALVLPNGKVDYSPFYNVKNFHDMVKGLREITTTKHLSDHYQNMQSTQMLRTAYNEHIDFADSHHYDREMVLKKGLGSRESARRAGKWRMITKPHANIHKPEAKEYVPQHCILCALSFKFVVKGDILGAARDMDLRSSA